MRSINNSAVTVNALCIEIHIAHPLVQLPAERELMAYYCPITKPHIQGRPQDSPQRCTIMWTVATSDIIRDIEIMAVLDEHVDFNHWCVLYRNSADGQSIRPYEYASIQFLFGELTGESAVLQEYDLDDPDCDSAIVDTPHRFANQINNINLLPSTTSADEDGLASLFSLWGDENPMHSSLVDFECGSVHSPIEAGSTCEANNNAGFDEEDEFAAAVRDANAKNGFPSFVR